MLNFGRGMRAYGRALEQFFRKIEHNERTYCLCGVSPDRRVDFFQFQLFGLSAGAGPSNLNNPRALSHPIHTGLFNNLT